MFLLDKVEGKSIYHDRTRLCASNIVPAAPAIIFRLGLGTSPPMTLHIILDPE
jgi:hypothetical protein